MAGFPRSLREFQARFPDDTACAAFLAAKRWPDSFRCPCCGGAKVWQLPSRKVPTFLCAGCRKETSITAGTIMHRSHLPLTVWFWAAFLMATHSNGMSALQLQSELGLGSYKTAWLLAMKLRLAMVAPGRSPLSGLVEADETEIRLRTKDDPPAGGQGRSHDEDFSQLLGLCSPVIASESQFLHRWGENHPSPVAASRCPSVAARLAHEICSDSAGP